MIELLENNQICKLATESDVIEGEGDADFTGVTLAELKKNLVVEDEFEMSGSKLDDLLAKLIQILEDISELGVKVLHGPDENETQVGLVQPRVQWSCWIMQKVNLLYIYGTMLTWWAVLIGVIGVSGYGSYRLYGWYQEKILREKQDVFELVEQVICHFTINWLVSKVCLIVGLFLINIELGYLACASPIFILYEQGKQFRYS